MKTHRVISYIKVGRQDVYLLLHLYSHSSCNRAVSISFVWFRCLSLCHNSIIALTDTYGTFFRFLIPSLFTHLCISRFDAAVCHSVTCCLFSLFTVDSHGVVRLSADASDLDEDRYTLLITVEDGGEPCRLANALVAVTFVHLPPDSNITGIPSTHPSMCTDCSTVADEEAVVMAAAVRAKLAAITLGVMLSILLIFVILLLVYIHTRLALLCYQCC